MKNFSTFRRSFEFKYLNLNFISVRKYLSDLILKIDSSSVNDSLVAWAEHCKESDWEEEDGNND